MAPPSSSFHLLPLLLLSSLAFLFCSPTASAQGPDTPVNCTLVGSCSSPSGLKYHCKLVNRGTTPLLNPNLMPLFNFQPTSIPDGCISAFDATGGGGGGGGGGSVTMVEPTRVNPIVLTSLPSFGSSKTFTFCQNLTDFVLNPSFLVPSNQYLNVTINASVAAGVPLELTCKSKGYDTVNGNPTASIKCRVFNFNQGLKARNILFNAFAPSFDAVGNPFLISGTGTSGATPDVSVYGPISGDSRTGNPYSFTVSFTMSLYSTRTLPITIMLADAFLTPK